MSVRSRLVLDILLFIALLTAFNPGATGISIHEWLSLAIVVPALLHLVINWDWVLRIASRVLARARAASKLNLAVDTLLFLATVTVMMSGLLISEVISAAFGLTLSADAIWYAIHSWSADATIVMLLVHGALHASWIARVLRNTRRQPVEVEA